MNPFIQTRAGVFAAMASKLGPPLICERICAAICSKLAQHPARSLDPDYWKEIVGLIPEQIAGADISGELTLLRDTASAQLAQLCVSPRFAADSLVDLSSGMNSLISQLPSFPCLNALGDRAGQERHGADLADSDNARPSDAATSSRALGAHPTGARRR